MMFLIQNFLYATCVLTTFSRFTHNARWILLICAALLAAIIPGLQYDVGSDYFAYIRLYLMYPGAFTERGGLAFEFFLSSLRLFDLDAQWLFFFAAVLFFFIFNVSMIYLNRNSISLMLFLVWFLFCSGLLHLHINGVRFSLCVALLFLSFICRFNKSNLLAVLFATASLLTHQLALFVFWIIFIPEAVFFWIYANRRLIFLITLMCQYVIFSSFVPYLASTLGLFGHYFKQEVVGADIINLITKAYYFPILMMGIFVTAKHESDFQKKLTALATLTVFTFILAYQNIYYVRFHHFFYIFQFILLTNIYSRIGNGLRPLFLLYITFPYFLKVLVFPSAEYKYESIVF